MIRIGPPFAVRQPVARRARRGAAAIEAAIVLSVFLAALFSMLDLALATLRANSLCECARRAARLAIVRGEGATFPLSPLGPESWSGTAADDHPFAEAVRPLLTTMQPDRVRITATWLDESHQPNDRVRVQLVFEHAPLVPFVFRDRPQPLTATSTMRIVH